MKKMINKDRAIEIFNEESILIEDENVLPFYKAIEIFGEDAAKFIDRHLGHNNYLIGGDDFNAVGSCTKERPIMYYFHRSGFLKLVSEYNYLICIDEYKSSEGGAVFDKYMKKRRERMDEEDRKYDESRIQKSARGNQNNKAKSV